MPKVAVIMGSKSDFEIVKPCIDTLKNFSVDTAVRVISAHRTPDVAKEFASTARQNGFEVIIAAAGKAAHLAGVLASLTTLPVIGIPVKAGGLGGLDSLLSTVQMPPGVPVATVAIDGAENAAVLAIQMLALKYPDLAEKLEAFKKSLRDKNIAADQELQNSLGL